MKASPELMIIASVLGTKLSMYAAFLRPIGFDKNLPALKIIELPTLPSIPRFIDAIEL